MRLLHSELVFNCLLSGFYCFILHLSKVFSKCILIPTSNKIIIIKLSCRINITIPSRSVVQSALAQMVD